MSEAKVVKNIAASADAVFAHLGDFSAIKAGGPIDAVSFEGAGVGMLRTLSMNGGEVIERLESHDTAAREFSYAILNDDSPLPFQGYSARVVVQDNGDGSCTVDWTGTFEPKGVDESVAVNVATGIYAGGIKGAKLALEKG